MRASAVQLTISEIAATDPRPIRDGLADAVRLADVSMRDLEIRDCAW
jgi:hypothetical protein